VKQKRQSKIYELVQTMEIETQAELTMLLSQSGFKVTQATVSRDIHEMKLTKTPTSNGTHKYAISASKDEQGMERLKRVFKDGFLSMDYAGNLLVIRTFNGMAMAVAAALDAMCFPEVLGSIAGDDVIMCAVKTEEQAVALMEKIRQ